MLATLRQTGSPWVITGGIMQIETLQAINEDLQANLMMMIEVIVLITVVFTIAALAIYVAGIAWFCFKERRRRATSSQMMRLASPPNIWKAPQHLSYSQVRKAFAHNPRLQPLSAASTRFLKGQPPAQKTHAAIHLERSRLGNISH
jgi:hypothetical protein